MAIVSLSYAKQTFSTVFRLGYSRRYFTAFVILFVAGLTFAITRHYSLAFTLTFVGGAFGLYAVYTARLRENLSKIEIIVIVVTTIVTVALSSIIDFVWKASDIMTIMLPAYIAWTINIPILGKLVYKIYSRGIERIKYLNS